MAIFNAYLVVNPFSDSITTNLCLPHKNRTISVKQATIGTVFTQQTHKIRIGLYEVVNFLSI